MPSTWGPPLQLSPIACHGSTSSPSSHETDGGAPQASGSNGRSVAPPTSNVNPESLPSEEPSPSGSTVVIGDEPPSSAASDEEPSTPADDDSSAPGSDSPSFVDCTSPFESAAQAAGTSNASRVTARARARDEDMNS